MIDLAVGHNGVGRFVRLWQSGRTAHADEAAGRRPASAPPATGPAEGYAPLFVRARGGPPSLRPPASSPPAPSGPPLGPSGARWGGGAPAPPRRSPPRSSVWC